MRFLHILFLLLIAHSTFAQNFDINLLKEINVNRNTHLDGSMKFISNSEYVIGIATPISVCAAAWMKHDFKLLEKGVNMSLAVVLNTGATYVVKHIVNRDRPAQTYPYIQALQNEKYYSFPSGHTSNAFCTATSLSLNFRKWYVIVPSYTWAAAVGYSRMHLGVHYPSDVFAGAILGAGSAWATYQVKRWLKKKFLEREIPNKEITNSK